jgi:hypothetical protein
VPSRAVPQGLGPRRDEVLTRQVQGSGARSSWL